MEKENMTPDEKWESLTLANNFIFYKVMRHHPDACQHLIEMLLGIKIEKMEMSNEETMIIDYDAKSIRLDVFVKDTDRMYDIEIQVVNTKELPERSRYYQAVMDVDTLKSGQKYKQLKDSHVIFICMEDIFDEGLPVYTFENLCLENGKTKLGDRAYKHFFIAPICAKLIEDESEKAFFKFLLSNNSNDDFTNHLRNYVDIAKTNAQWRVQYMNWERQRAYDFDAGMEKGLAEGEARGAKAAKAEAARNFLANGVDPEIVAKSIGMTMEEVLSLKNQ